MREIYKWNINPDFYSLHFKSLKQIETHLWQVTYLRPGICVDLTFHHQEEELNKHPRTPNESLRNLSTGCVGIWNKGPETVETDLMLVIQLKLRLPGEPTKAVQVPGPLNRNPGNFEKLHRSGWSSAGHRSRITASGQQLSSDVMGSACFHLTTDHLLGTWTSYLTPLVSVSSSIKWGQK